MKCSPQIIWPLAVSTFGPEERAAVIEVLDSGHLTAGERVREFERAFAAYVGSEHAVMTNSGSSANLLAVAAMRYAGGSSPPPLSPMGDVAVVPAIAWSTTYAPLQQHGLKLTVMDVDPDTLNIDADRLEEALKLQPNTRLLVGVSVLGNPAPLVEMQQFAREHGLWFWEDNCESLGAQCIADSRWKYAGTFGHLGTYSTFFSHHLSTIEGGMLVTDDRELADVARCLRAHGWTRDLPPNSHLRQFASSSFDAGYQFVLPGYNLRPTEIAAAIGLVQLGKLDAMNNIRRSNAREFIRVFGDDPRFTLQREEGIAAPFGFTMILRDQATRARAFEAMDAAGIEYRLITGGCFTAHPVAWGKHYNYVQVDQLPHANHAHACGFFVGNHPVDLTKEIHLLHEALKGI